jgi:hypothetical protein
MERIQVAKVSEPEKPQKPFDPLRYLAEFCRYYPRYSLAEARRLPYKHVRLMMGEARRAEARKLYYLTQIAAAPYSEKREEVTKLMEHFREIMDA